jgi:hypothetical protein
MARKSKEVTRRWTLTKAHGELEGVEGSDEVFRLSDGVTSIYMVEGLRVHRSSNMEMPFIIEGHGGATVHLTYEQMVYVMLEYLRHQAGYAVDGSTHVAVETVAFSGSVLVKEKADH